MDLSFNNFSGSLSSESFTNWVAMTHAPNGNKEQWRYMVEIYSFHYYLSSMTVINKGLEMELERILKTFIFIDLSNNRFDGEQVQ